MFPINARYKNPQNLKELISGDCEELENWLDRVPDNFRWWFENDEPTSVLYYPGVEETFYPCGLRYNGKVLLFLIAHGSFNLYRRFIKNFLKENPENIPLKMIVENVFDRMWFVENKATEDYTLGSDLRVYLNDIEKFRGISRMSPENGEKLYKRCHGELRMLKSFKKKDYIFLVRVLTEITRIKPRDTEIANFELRDKALYEIAYWFYNEKSLIRNTSIAKMRLKEIADNPSSRYQTKAAKLFTDLIDWKNDLEKAKICIKYLKIAERDNRPSICHSLALLYKEVGEERLSEEYFRKSSELNYQISQSMLGNLKINRKNDLL